MQNAARVLILATSRKTRGGITSVLKEHEQSRYWKEFRCRWLETHRDGNILVKIGYFLKSFVTYLFILPAYDLVHIHTSEPPSALRKVCFVLYGPGVVYQLNASPYGRDRGLGKGPLVAGGEAVRWEPVAVVRAWYTQ